MASAFKITTALLAFTLLGACFEPDHLKGWTPPSDAVEDVVDGLAADASADADSAGGDVDADHGPNDGVQADVDVDADVDRGPDTDASPDTSGETDTPDDTDVPLVPGPKIRVVCVPNQCQLFSTLSKDGERCVATDKLEGTPCNDGNACTVGAFCHAGECVPGEPVDCDDNDACTFDICNQDAGCLHQDITFTCDDGNVCTSDICDSELGCVFDAAAGSCDDGSVCTLNDYCDGGACVSDDSQTCDDGNYCTADACDPVNGCVFTEIDACGDGRCNCGESYATCAVDCTPDGTCGDGVCEPGQGENGCNCWDDCDSGTSSGSCQGVCGGQSPDGCFCDAQCEDFGDCCEDKVDVCGCIDP